ncbi:SusC/RagA family TonB-linked outer membrane protein [Pedobacter gandavensis]|uniref:SusC/RagA family TonB-linked outer membrane protein n=1 Tax=Pedobacter gandavensis TaxID=2679963 RepID=UPI002479CFD2|nr:SusC/RagA family TonB-linked outer membrane protein [Pedobacter gandavensis]WGQ07900.1 SusC/RagA family TonB-linked outer membrane protein [Pedobacter gandavensis]
MKKLLQSLFILLFIASTAMAQDRTITGTVTDTEDGKPLPGVTVKIKGTQTGTQTGADGKYAVKVNSSAATLEFSYLGYVAKSVTLGAGNVVNVSLASDSKALNEVVVTSFGIQRDKKSLGYSTTKIGSEELNTSKSTNVTNELVGKVPGVRASGSGGAFTGSGVIIRGMTTFTGSNQPLYVVDGVPIDNSGGNTPLQSGPSLSNRAIDINPDDIENIVVLKDAAATSTYGSRGASGVILITTKKGKKNEKGTITVSSSYNVGNVNRLPEYQNEYAQGSNGVLNVGNATVLGSGVNTSWGPKIMGQAYTNAHGQAAILTAYPDNVKDIFQQSYNLQNNVSFAGGTEKSTFRLAYGNSTETYVIANNKLKRNNLTFSGTTDVTSKFTVGSSITYTNTNSIRTLQGNQLSNPLFRAYFTPRSYDLTGLPFEDATGGQLFPFGEDNPYWTIKYNKYNDEVNRILGNANAQYRFTDWLNVDLKVGTDFFNLKSKGFDEVGNRGGGFTGATSRLIGGVVDNSNNVRNFTSYFTVNANKKFGDFNLLATLGNEINQNSIGNMGITGYNVVIPGFDNIKNTLIRDPFLGSSKTRLMGVFADFVVDYKGYLSLNLKARNDWSSTLTPENRSIFYPAAALSFVLTDAFPELKDDKYVNQIKFRVSAGEVGKGAPAYTTSTYYDQSSAGDGTGAEIIFPYNGLAGYTLNDTAGDPNLTPEFTREISYGTELAFFKNRLTLDATYYTRNTRSVILSVPYSAASGISSLYKNAGKLSTKGFEFMLSGTPLKTLDFSWDISLNFTKYKSTVEELAPGVTDIFLAGFTTPNIQLVAGDEYGQIYGSAYQRNDAGQLLLNARGLPIATSEVKKIGNPNPDYTAGIFNTFKYKEFSLSFLIDIRKGGDQYSRNIADVQRNGAAKETAEFPRFEADNVTPTKPYKFEGVYASGANAGQPNTTMLTAQEYYGNSGKYIAAEGYIYDTSWFRIREAALNYRLPQSVIGKTPFRSVEFGVFGRNLYLKAKNYPHFDPEQNAFGVSNAQGLEFNSLPSSRTVGVNLKLVL